MASNQTDILIALNEIDQNSQSKIKALDVIESAKIKIEKKIAAKKNDIQKFEAALSQAGNLRKAEQEKLDEEQTKIIERRKQISSLGGAKSAKLVERELGVAKRVTETLEQNVMSALQTEETLEKKLQVVKSDIETLTEELAEASESVENNGAALSSEIEVLMKSRDSSIKKLDDRIAKMYTKIETRYKGDAIAYAVGGACRSCFRALPAQVFNQIIAGQSLIQCPGCSRLMVYVPSDEEVVEPKETKPKKAKAKSKKLTKKEKEEAAAAAAAAEEVVEDASASS